MTCKERGATPGFGPHRKLLETRNYITRGTNTVPRYRYCRASHKRGLYDSSILCDTSVLLELNNRSYYDANGCRIVLGRCEHWPSTRANVSGERAETKASAGNNNKKSQREPTCGVACGSDVLPLAGTIHAHAMTLQSLHPSVQLFSTKAALQYRKRTIKQPPLRSVLLSVKACPSP
jgi:hypothetical protein